MNKRDALLIVDVQNDFCPGGALAVPDGDEVIPVINEYIRQFADLGAPVFASRDWHPRESKHFMAWGGPWPPHCIQNTPGAAFHPELVLPEDVVIITKGSDPTDDGYSAFEGDDPHDLALEASLREHGVERVFVAGLATDYCVRASVLDALENELDVVVLRDAIKGIDVNDGDIDDAMREMKEAGARFATMKSLEKATG